MPRLPSLDGLRACSIGLVIVSHLVPPLVGYGDTGVSVFFVLSGFLITHLLVQEEARTGGIDLPAFYLRRTLRIWPAFYAFLGVIALTGAVTSRDLVVSGLFLRNYVAPAADPWLVGHTWSLSVEEQFYLVWPLALVLIRPARRLPVAVGVIVAGPVVRVLSYLLWPDRRGWENVMLHTRADTLMFGCLLALLLAAPEGRALARRGWLALPVVLLSPVLAALGGPAYRMLAMRTIEGAAIAAVLAWVVLRPDTIAGRLLNTRLAVSIGVRSYSLYLWQQTVVHGLPGVPWPVRLLAIGILAECSYRLVEGPALRLKARHRISTQSSAVVPPGAVAKLTRNPVVALSEIQ